MNALKNALFFPPRYLFGMSEYESNNAPTIDRLREAFANEWKEFEDAWKDGNLYGIWDELNDVIHTGVKYVGYRLGLNRYLIYLLCMMFATKTAWKHAGRYGKHNCIRNDTHCRAGNHICNYTKLD